MFQVLFQGSDLLLRLDIEVHIRSARSAECTLIRQWLTSSANAGHQLRFGEELFSREQKHSSQRVPEVGWGDTGFRKQMLVLEQLQHVQRTSDPVSAHEQRGGRNV